MRIWQHVLAAAAGKERVFATALSRPQHHQESLLSDILRANAASEFGRRHGFSGLESVSDYRSAVPVRTFEDFAPDIDRIHAGEAGVLTEAPVIAFEETSGSARAAKLIPYTRKGLDAFAAAVLPWLCDLASQRPGIAGGPCYWAISPAARAERYSPGGVRIGLASDAAYFGDAVAPSIGELSAVPPDLAAITDIDTWRMETLRHLLLADDLTFISVWSPTFLTQLLQGLISNAEPLVKAVHDGAGTSHIAPRPQRARTIERALASGPIDHAALWPRLDTVSCWTDGTARSAARSLTDLLPGVHIQGKGLLATEAVVSVPIGKFGGPVPALTSTFCEFVDPDGNARMAHELEAEQTYRAVVTTWSGLYRYDLGDEVRCTNVTAGIPALEFVGRVGANCDLVGEKLSEKFVAVLLSDQPGFAALVPCPSGQAGYLLIHDNPSAPSDLGRQIERRLAENPQYSYARRLGQLSPLQCVFRATAMQDYTDHHLKSGMRLGDIKPKSLITEPEFCRRLAENNKAGHNIDTPDDPRTRIE